jgi:hypothetical protein
MTTKHEMTPYQEAQPTTRRSTQRSTQRSTPTTPEHESSPSNQTMKFQPTSQSQDRKSGADLGITIRWGVRAGGRRHTHTTTVDLVRGW